MSGGPTQRSPQNADECTRIMRANLLAVEAECDEVFAMLSGLPEDDPRRPMLLKIHERLSNIVGTMRANLSSVS